MSNKLQILYHWVLLFWIFSFYISSSLTFGIKKSTATPSKKNNSETLPRRNSANKPSSKITFLLPQGEVKVEINNRGGNESQKQMETLVESLKSAFRRLGYGLQLSTSAGHYKRNRTKSSVQMSNKGRPYHGARDLDLYAYDNDEKMEWNITNGDSSTYIEDSQQTYTDYDTLYGYNNDEPLVDPQYEDKAYTVNGNRYDEFDPDISHSNGEKQRALTETNGTIADDNFADDAEQYDKFMAPAEQEYENFGKAPSNCATDNGLAE